MRRFYLAFGGCGSPAGVQRAPNHLREGVQGDATSQRLGKGGDGAHAHGCIAYLLARTFQLEQSVRDEKLEVQRNSD